MNASNMICRQNLTSDTMLASSVYSIIGQRETQQDFAGLLQNGNQILAVVCDGMGGLSSGEIASRTAVQTLVKDYIARKPIEDSPAFLRQEAGRMDREVSSLKSSDGSHPNAGTTTVTVLIQEMNLFWMSVGDSRLYLLRDGKLNILTKDHNYRRELDEMLERGAITEEYMKKECRGKRAEALTSYVGMGGLRRIERNTEPFILKSGDCLMLCSDGVYKSLNERQICAMLEDNQISPEISARRLVRMALTQAVKRQDNTTAVMIHVDTPKEEITDGTML